MPHVKFPGGAGHGSFTRLPSGILTYLWFCSLANVGFPIYIAMHNNSSTLHIRFLRSGDTYTLRFKFSSSVIVDFIWTQAGVDWTEFHELFLFQDSGDSVLYFDGAEVVRLVGQTFGFPRVSTINITTNSNQFDMEYFRLVDTGNGADRNWDVASSDTSDSSTEILDISANASHMTLVNMPTDGSQWGDVTPGPDPIGKREFLVELAPVVTFSVVKPVVYFDVTFPAVYRAGG